MFIITILILSFLPESSLAQIEPQPEVDVVCENYWAEALNGNPKNSEYGLMIVCTIQNDNPYQVEVETDLRWVYTNDHDSSIKISLDSNEEIYVQFQLFAPYEAQPAFESMTFETTVVEYGNVRECTDCETTSHSLEIEVLAWTSVELELLSENPEGTFGLERVKQFQKCDLEGEYQLSARIEVDGNHDVNPGIGFEYDYFYPFSYNEPGLIKVEVPSKLELGIGVRESTVIEATFTLEQVEYQSENVYVLFILVLGELDDVSEYLKGSGSNGLEFYYGGCFVDVAESQRPANESMEPIIIETNSGNSMIYLLAGIGGATTICLLIALIFVLTRKRD